MLKHTWHHLKKYSRAANTPTTHHTCFNVSLWVGKTYNRNTRFGKQSKNISIKKGLIRNIRKIHTSKKNKRNKSDLKKKKKGKCVCGCVCVRLCVFYCRGTHTVRARALVRSHVLIRRGSMGEREPPSRRLALDFDCKNRAVFPQERKKKRLWHQ